ncbi:MAG: hypothetical protein OXF41_15685 [bacterium]|nr:hypothetical protein [bacterium]
MTAAATNWAAHTTRPLEAQVAMEYLASVSVLARWVEAATVLMAAAAESG